MCVIIFYRRPNGQDDIDKNALVRLGLKKPIKKKKSRVKKPTRATIIILIIPLDSKIAVSNLGVKHVFLRGKD